MAETTGIDWTDSTFNPWIGCTKVGPGCDNCYAEALMDKRWSRVHWGRGQARARTSEQTWRNPLSWERSHERFMELHGRRQRVFCASLADVFDNEIPIEWRDELWELIKSTPNLDWLILTKRIGNVAGMTPSDGIPSNVWLGATIVNQAEWDRDIQKLISIESSVRFVSAEPLLGPISCGAALNELDWVIVGGESGHYARQIKREWVDSLRNECNAANVAFFFKQWGGVNARAGGCALDGLEIKQWPLIS